MYSKILTYTPMITCTQESHTR